ncbi:glutaminyl-tRNA synthetase [Venturia nashicola]|uniref:glutamine--tRNA ligase n=1 Tax=Venturia nashicola TaxID=86259 RepID=A0A4Z1P2I8_9PEZI|nr:glutaminyl-tRNA synthetase [Venturia nashicola]
MADAVADPSPKGGVEVPAEGEAPKMSKRALEKEKKKAEKAAKKAGHKTELTSRPKPASATTTTPASAAPANPFVQGWLKAVREEKLGAVRTRFPPEPNGYLHIGHAKAIATNFGFAKQYDGICFLRYDDTNPAKEEDIYFRKIKEMVEWLGFEPYQITHSSDYFDKLYEHAIKLVELDKAYVCYCSKEEVNLQRGGPDNRGKRFGCTHRDRPISESLAEFKAMEDGKYKPGEAVLRMKQSLTDPNEGNPQLWDLAAYRIVENSHHPRTGDKWKIYPTYDFAHCLCDYYEGITHSLCTTEFFQSRVSYDWLLEVLDLKTPKSEEKGPMQREYGRLNVEGTILSKRRIAALVNGATFEIKKDDGTTTTRTVPPAVRGWDDPRLYTLIAIRRRGVPGGAILNFVSELGVTTTNSNIMTYRFESSIRKYLERTVSRLMLVLDPIKVIIEDLPDGHKEDLTVPFDPKDASKGSRIVQLSKEISIDRSDFREADSADFFRAAPGKVVGLLNAPFAIKITSFSKGSDGKVTEIKATKVEGEKPKAYIHWVGASAIKVTARQYNNLFLCEEPNGLDWKSGQGKDFYADHLNPDSEIVLEHALIESGINELKKGNSVAPDSGASDNLVRFQAVRTAYFCVDPESTDDKLVLNQIVSLKEDAGKGKGK